MEVTAYRMHPELDEAVSEESGLYQGYKMASDLLLEYNISFVVKQAFFPQNRAKLGEFGTWAARSFRWIKTGFFNEL